MLSVGDIRSCKSLGIDGGWHHSAAGNVPIYFLSQFTMPLSMRIVYEWWWLNLHLIATVSNMPRRWVMLLGMKGHVISSLYHWYDLSSIRWRVVATIFYHFHSIRIKMCVTFILIWVCFVCIVCGLYFSRLIPSTTYADRTIWWRFWNNMTTVN